jgi:SAND domain
MFSASQRQKARTAAAPEATAAGPRPSRPGSKRPYDNLEPTIPGDEDDEYDEDMAKPLAPTDITLQVICNNVAGLLNPATCKVVHEGKEMTATQFEHFAGCGSAKKWKASLRIVPGQVPECPRGEPP